MNRICFPRGGSFKLFNNVANIELASLTFVRCFPPFGNKVYYKAEPLLLDAAMLSLLIDGIVRGREQLVLQSGQPSAQYKFCSLILIFTFTLILFLINSMANVKPKTEISLAGTFASSAFSACWAEICTIPLDTAKVRLQLQGKQAAGQALAAPKYRGMFGTVATIAREEGLTALWKGIVPGLHRQCLFGGLRIGLYEPVKSLYVGKDFVGDVPLHKKILAALTTGAVAITVASPTDLVKVRLQAEGKLPPGVPRRYSGAMNAYATIVREEGLGALWTGLGPNVARNAIINAAELASYDQVKQTLLKLPGFSDNVFTHLLSGLGAGFFAVCIGSPVDVVKSRMMGDSKAYKNTFHCFIKTFKNDGPLAFYKGFVPNFGRLGSWNVIMFLTLEQAKKFFSKEVPS